MIQTLVLTMDPLRSSIQKTFEYIFKSMTLQILCTPNNDVLFILRENILSAILHYI